jgi:hypothetical protein
MDYPTLVLAPFCRPKVEFVSNSHIGDYAVELFVHHKDFPSKLVPMVLFVMQYFNRNDVVLH